MVFSNPFIEPLVPRCPWVFSMPFVLWRRVSRPGNRADVHGIRDRSCVARRVSAERPAFPNARTADRVRGGTRIARPGR
jgi:hypothetical protein